MFLGFEDRSRFRKKKEKKTQNLIAAKSGLVGIKGYLHTYNHCCRLSLEFTIMSIGVLIQREPKDYHSLGVLKNSIFCPKSIFVLENVNSIESQIK